MAPETFVSCPKCGHEYNVHKQVLDRGPDGEMFCPMCMATYKVREAKTASASTSGTSDDE